MMLRIVRDQSLANNIVIVDGLSKSGKSLVMPLISSLSKGELPQFDHIFEYIATFRHLGNIDYHAAASLIKLYVDLDLYNVMIGRNTNFRKKDDSSAFANLLEERQRKRLTDPDGEIVIRQIQKRNPILVLMVHYIFQASDIFFDALGKRLKLYIMSVRHPAWLVEGWGERNWDERFNKNPRDFQICVNVNGKKVPWFANKDPDYYLSLGPLEQSIYVVHLFIKNIEQHYNRLSPRIKKKIMFVPFELFMATPVSYLRQIAKRTGSALTNFTRSVLKQVNLPRRFDIEEIRDKRNQISRMLQKKKVSKKIQSMFDSLCDNYEQKYLTNNGRFSNL